MEVILKNDRMFQAHKLRLVGFTKRHWEIKHLKILNDFISECEKNRYGHDKQGKRQILKWLNYWKKEQYYFAPFSKQYLDLLNQLEPIFNPAIVKEWRIAYTKCCDLLRALGQKDFITENIPAIEELKAFEKLQYDERLTNVVSFFKQIDNEKNDVKLGIWLKNQTMKSSYFYPFFISQELEYKPSTLTSSLNQENLKIWKELYPKVYQRLNNLKLTHYLEEVPPIFLDLLDM